PFETLSSDGIEVARVVHWARGQASGSRTAFALIPAQALKRSFAIFGQADTSRNRLPYHTAVQGVVTVAQVVPNSTNVLPRLSWREPSGLLFAKSNCGFRNALQTPLHGVAG